MNITEIYDKYGDEEFLKFERVENKRSQRPDLHAFLLLDELVPDKSDIIAATMRFIFRYRPTDSEKSRPRSRSWS